VESSGAISEPGVRAGIDLIRLIAELPERHQQVLRLYYMEERSYEDVARLLDLPMGTVKVSLHRARKQLARAAARSKMETGTT
jgi:RNA polymerase sigma-70 factor (ECF subfamily)